MMKKVALAGMMALATASACKKESIRELYAKQEDRIETFVENQIATNDSYHAINQGGSTRLTIVDGTGDALDEGGTVSLYYAGYVMSSTSISASNLFATNHPETAKAASWDLSDSATVFTPVSISMTDGGIVEGLRNGLVGVQEGEEAYILFSGEHGFGKRQIGTIPANAAVAYHIWVESISNE